MAKQKLILRTAVGRAVEVRFRRWFNDPEIINHIAGLTTVTAPLALSKLGALNISPGWLITWTVVLTSVNYIAGIILKRATNTVVVGKGTMKEVETASVAADDENEQVRHEDTR